MKTMEDEAIDNAPYNANGYKDREEYLQSLTKSYGIDITTVRMVSDLLGPSEDFDALVTELEDFAEMDLSGFSD
jgi:hypothetical protein